MSWIFIAILAYFLIALQTVLDKFLLSSKKVSHPTIYAFYTGILSLFTLVLLPWGFNYPGFFWALMYVFFGLIFVYGILGIFFAINKSEASRVLPVVGVVIPIVTYFIEYFFLGNNLDGLKILGIGLLIAGGIVISFELPLKINQKKFFQGLYPSLIAGVLLAIAFSAFSYFYAREKAFINVFVWTRLGLVAGALSLLIFSPWRKVILSSLKNFKEDKKEKIKTGNLFVGNKILGGFGSILVNYAISLGSVTVVNALVSIQYVFIFLIGIAFARIFPHFFQEKHDGKSIFQKLAAISIVGLGLVLISI